MESRSIYLQENFLGKKVTLIGKDNKARIELILHAIHSWGIAGEDCDGNASLVPWHLLTMVIKTPETAVES